MKRVCVLGATGSVGRQALEVCAAAPDEYRVVAVAARRDVDGLRALASRHRPALVGVADESAARAMGALPEGARMVTGEGAAAELAAHGEVDVVVAGIVGFAGLLSTLAALRAGKTVALANKEALVVAGEICLQAAREGGAIIIPVDSEHSAIFQVLGCLSPSAGTCGHDRAEIDRLIITGSGGPLRLLSVEDLARVTVAEALRHPTWSMGPKITIDSATLMNKALEVIEARFLFGVAPERIEVLIHPESLVHSMVEFVDGAILAQLGDHDMRGPIGYALGWPRRRPLAVKRLDLTAIGKLTFQRPDAARFPCVAFGHEALRRGGTAPAALSAANEVAVAAFLAGRIAFPVIAAIIEETLSAHAPRSADSLDAVLDADRDAREDASRRIARMPA
ncbi:MAG: 1-deoxy-D-xylulose-5-phosphate reductoisomerase [Myxococcota bacterium]